MRAMALTWRQGSTAQPADLKRVAKLDLSRERGQTEQANENPGVRVGLGVLSAFQDLLHCRSQNVVAQVAVVLGLARLMMNSSGLIFSRWHRLKPGVFSIGSLIYYK